MVDNLRQAEATILLRTGRAKSPWEAVQEGLKLTYTAHGANLSDERGYVTYELLKPGVGLGAFDGGRWTLYKLVGPYTKRLVGRFDSPEAARDAAQVDESLTEAHSKMPATARTTFDSAPYANMRLLDVARFLQGASRQTKPNLKLITKLVDRLVHALEFTIYSIQGRPEGRRIGSMIRKAFNNLTARLPELVLGERRTALKLTTRLNEAVETLDIGPVEAPARLESVDEAIKFREAGVSPLKYKRASGIERVVLCDTSVTDPPEPSDTYFAHIERWRRFSKRGKRRRLKKPVLDEIIPGVDDNCIVAFLDYHQVGPKYYYIDYMKSRRGFTGKGYAMRVVEGLYRMLAAKGADHIHWGKMMHPAVGHMLDKMKARYPDIVSLGAVNY
jgi:hypothetical protein